MAVRAVAAEAVAEVVCVLLLILLLLLSHFFFFYCFSLSQHRKQALKFEEIS